MNPMKYRPAQIAKALIAALTSVMALLGLAAATFGEGTLATVGTWATAAFVFLTPILVFLKRAEPWIGILDGIFPGAGEQRIED